MPGVERMPSLYRVYRVIRRCEAAGGEPVFLVPRYEFPPLPKDAGGEPAEREAAESAAAREAEEILARAREEAAAILEAARREAAELARKALEEAREEGRSQGYREGYAEAMARVQEEAEALREEARHVLRQAEELRRATLASLEGEILALAREMAEKIVAAQLSVDPDLVLHIVREALEAARGRGQVVVYVSPEQKAAVEARREEIRLSLPPGTVLHVIGDPALKVGECRVETPDGSVDATLDARWRALREALGEAV